MLEARIQQISWPTTNIKVPFWPGLWVSLQPGCIAYRLNWQTHTQASFKAMKRSSHGQIRNSNSSTNHDILLKLKEVGWSDRWVSTMIGDYFLWADGHLDSNQRSQDIQATAIRNNHRSSLKPTSPAIHLPTLVKYHCSLTTDRSSEFGLGICPWDEQPILSASARILKTIMVHHPSS